MEEEGQTKAEEVNTDGDKDKEETMNLLWLTVRVGLFKFVHSTKTLVLVKHSQSNIIKQLDESYLKVSKGGTVRYGSWRLLQG